MTCCNSKFFYFNLVTQDETVLSVNSEDPFFPLSNIKDHRVSKILRTQEGITDLELTFDFITTEDINHVLVQAGPEGFGWSGDLTIKANATNSGWGSPAFSTTLTPSDEFDKGFVSFDTQSYRFWRIEASNPLGDYVELSKIFIGKELIINPSTTRNIQFGWRSIIEDNSNIEFNRYRERFIDIINKKKSIRGSFKFLNKTEMANMMEMFNYSGRTNPVWLILDENESFSDDKHRFMFYGFFNRIPEVTNVAFGLYDLSFEVEE